MRLGRGFYKAKPKKKHTAMRLITDFAIGILTAMALFTMAGAITYLLWTAMLREDSEENENTPKDRKP